MLNLIIPYFTKYHVNLDINLRFLNNSFNFFIDAINLLLL
jgi:hypothetical protein